MSSARLQSLVLLGSADSRGEPRWHATGVFVGSDGLIVTSHEGWPKSGGKGVAAVAKELGTGSLHCLIDDAESGLVVLRLVQAPVAARRPVPLEFSTEDDFSGATRAIGWSEAEGTFRGWPVNLPAGLQPDRIADLSPAAVLPAALSGAPLLGDGQELLRGVLRLSDGAARVVPVDRVQQLLQRARRAGASACGSVIAHPAMQ